MICDTVDAMSKAHFLELLKTTPAVAAAAQEAVNAEKAAISKPIHVVPGSGAAWLRDDFMRQAEMKDWEQEADDEGISMLTMFVFV